MATKLRIVLLVLPFVSTACADVAPVETGEEQVAATSSGPGDSVRLALEVEDGVGKPVTLRAGQSFYLNQIDMRVSTTTNVDEGISGLTRAGDFSTMPWGGAHVRDTDFELLQNADGTWTRRRFYLDAAWMDLPQLFLLEQLDAAGRPLHAPMIYVVGPARRALHDEAFFTRRMRAIQWTNDCPVSGDCTGAQNFLEEALVELRNTFDAGRTFSLDGRTASLRLTWSANGHRYTIPVTQDESPPYAYGFSIDVKPVASNPPQNADGTFTPGSVITFKVTLKDGAGTALHPDGELPTYDEVEFGENTAGVQYYRAFFDATSLYYRRKHRERMFISEILGPLQDAQPIRSLIPVDDLLSPAIDVQPVATLERDGVFCQYRTFPTSYKLFGGAFDPTHAAWADPVPDTWQFTLPANAPAGTYVVTTKARRVYEGEDMAASSIVKLQVGTTTPTHAELHTGNCQNCHSGQTSLGVVLHTIADRSTCAGCHAPLPFEYDAPVYVRVHFVHSRSSRYDAPLIDCAQCHLDNGSIQRTSKSACLSCHSRYPKDHVERYGPIINPYVGGATESFNVCSTTCHTTHPGSGLSRL